MLEDKCNWFEISNVEEVDSPSLIVYKERVTRNIASTIKMVPSVELLRPHIKTSKSVEVVQLMMDQGIKKFKGATIAELEVLASCKVNEALLAYQPTLQTMAKLIELIRAYPNTKFSCLVDNAQSVEMIANYAKQENSEVNVFIDLDAGMGRTGIIPEKAFELYKKIDETAGLQFSGFHCYDGHIRDKDFALRKQHCNKVFEKIESLRDEVEKSGFSFPLLVAGGSPTFAIHASRRNVEVSPGTFVFWDKGYQETIPEQHLDFAALVLARVISMPEKTKICIDLGYKAIASENDLQRRVYFLNHPELRPFSHSEEHMVIEVGENHSYKIGDVFYALPYHICPTVAMFDTAKVVVNSVVAAEWKVNARGRGSIS